MLTVSKLNFSYDDLKVLWDIDLEVHEGEIVSLIGANGAGKSTVASCLEILQNIGRGVNRIKNLVQPNDFSRGRSAVPMRFEIEAVLSGQNYQYTLALELPENFKELRVLEEKFIVSGRAVFSRHQAQISLSRNSSNRSEAQFSMDWHIVALSFIQEQSETGPLSIFRRWLSRMIILAPIPSLMTGASNDETLEPQKDGGNFSDWLSGLLSLYPASYGTIEKYLQEVMPDISEIRNDPTGKDTKNMNVHFCAGNEDFGLNFRYLSDGEKCFFLCAVVLAANKAYGPLFCFWDEPDNYLSLSEIGNFILSSGCKTHIIRICPFKTLYPIICKFKSCFII